MNLGYFNQLRQYWMREVEYTIFTGVLVSILMLYAAKQIGALPRSSTTLLATMLSTLLGLTFTAFSIFTAFMGNFTLDFVETKTFLNIGKMFRLVMAFELVSLATSIVTYLSYGTKLYLIGMFVSIFTLSLSLMYFWNLLNRTFRLFRIFRENLIKNH